MTFSIRNHVQLDCGLAKRVTFRVLKSLDMRIFYLLILLSFCVKPVLADNSAENDVLSTTACTTDTTWLPVAHFCWGQTVTIFGDNYSGFSGTAYSQVYLNILGCDSIVAQDYIKHSPANGLIEICEGDSVLINSVYWSQNHNFSYPGLGQWGCDSTLRLRVRPVYSMNQTIWLIGNDSTNLGGTWQSQSGNYTTSYSSQFGCDSIVITEVIAVPSSAAPISSTSWESVIGGLGDDQIIDMETDRFGNLYVVLIMEGAFKTDPWGGGYIESQSSGKRKLLKYDPQGLLIWKKDLPFLVTSLAVNASDKLAITGTFKGSQDFDLKESSYFMLNSQGRDVFIATYDLDAQLTWVRHFESWQSVTGNNLLNNGKDRSGDVVFGSNDEVVITLIIESDTFDIDPDPLNQIIHSYASCGACGGNRSNRLLLALNNQGQYLWHDLAASNQYCPGEHMTRLAVDNQNNLIETFSGCTGGNSPRFFIRKRSLATSNIIWTKRFPNSSWQSDWSLDTEIDHLDNIYVMGTMGDYTVLYPNPEDSQYKIYSQAYDGPAFTSNSSFYPYNLYSSNTWLAKYSSQGEHIWSFSQLESEEQYYTREAPGFGFEIIGNTIVLSGQTLRDIDIDPTEGEWYFDKSYPNDYDPEAVMDPSFDYDPNWDAYIALYTLDLEPIGAWVNGGEGDQGKPHLSGDLNGYVRVGGHFTQDVVLPPDSLETPLTLGFSRQDVFYNSVYIDSSEVFATTFDTMYVCGNDSVEYNGQFFSGIGSHYAGVRLLNTFYNAHSYLELVQDSSALVPVYENQEICNGDSIFLGGAYQTAAGIYIDTIVVSGECDTLLTTNLTFATQTTLSDTLQMCLGDSVYLSGAYQTTAGTYTDSTGCAIIQTVLQISNPTINAVINQTNPMKTAIAYATSFVWIDCSTDSIVSGANEYYFYPGYAGSFAIVVDSLGCTDTSACVYDDPALYNKNGIGLVKEAYPSIIQQDYTIQFYQEETDISIDVFTVQGQLVWKESFPKANGVNLNLNALAEGYYMVRVKTSRGVETLKAMRTLF